MRRAALITIFTGLLFAFTSVLGAPGSATDLSVLHKDERIHAFKVANLYVDGDGKVIGAKFWHLPSGMPVFLQIETVPQVYTWVDTPVESDRGLPHALEHLLAEKGTTGRYFTLLSNMRLSQSAAATWRDFNLYSFVSGSGTDGFFDVFHSWLTALYHPDFTEVEAQREFYHFAVSTDPVSKIKTLSERGTVYNEEQTGEGEESCYHNLDKQILGAGNPLAANIGGDPDQMRAVTPQEIREFHREHYRLGPTTGFIFVVNPKENIPAFLERISREFERLPSAKTAVVTTQQSSAGNPKYPIHSLADLQPRICPVPGGNEAAPADIWFGWKPKKFESMRSLRMLDLFYRGLADGQQSLLYKALVDRKTRIADTGATSIALDSARSESPRYSLWKIQVSGIPGNHLSVGQITQVRNAILARVREVSDYPDGSPALAGFNEVIESYARAERRSKNVWRKSPPLFGVRLDANWKDFLEYLEMDPSFVRSMAQEDLWNGIESDLKSGKNIWRSLIQEFGLLDPPYSEATPSSPELQKKLEIETQQRISTQIESLKHQYGFSSDQEALAHFEHDELVKTKEIDKIEAQVSKPHFTDHPPLVPDEDMRYSQFTVSGVPALASIFERPPSLELGLSFDLHQVPQKYYKYLPLLARSFDSVGLKESNHITQYQTMSAETHSRFVEFGASVSANGFSKRADLNFRASATSVPELREALGWIQRSLLSSYIDPANVDRLRDIVAEQLSADSSYTKQDEFSWVYTPAQAFRYQADPLYLAVDSQFTKAHWDGRLYWLLHEPVPPDKIDHLASFATNALATLKGTPKAHLAQTLNDLKAEGIEAELVEHWRRNLDSFPDDRLLNGLQRLADEVVADLRTGPANTINDLRQLQQLLVNRRALSLDLLVNSPALEQLRPDLEKFVAAIPDRVPNNEQISKARIAHPIIDKLRAEYSLNDLDFPWHLGFVNPEEFTGNAIFYSDFVDYTQTDRQSLMKLLSSAILAGRGPGSLYMRAHQAGLAYALLLKGDPSRGLILYYADRSMDVPSLVADMNSAVDGIANTKDPYLVDYALRQLFSLPRSIYTFSIRERAFAQEMRDGNTPEKVRRFYEALLKLRHDPALLSQLTAGGKDSLCGILLEEKCGIEQRVNHSLFFFVGSEKILSDTERRLGGTKLLRIWPSDYWLP
jgi:hypothetical protein